MANLFLNFTNESELLCRYQLSQINSEKKIASVIFAKLIKIHELRENFEAWKILAMENTKRKLPYDL